MSIQSVWGGPFLLAWLTACGGASHSDAPASAGNAGAGSGGASAGAGAAGSSFTSGAGGLASLAGAGGGSAGGPPVDIGPQAQSDKLDVLFVIDNSSSMAGKQAVLSASIPGFVSRLTNPWCVDAQGKPTAQQPASASAACTSGKREFSPISDIHFGAITTSIGGHGGMVCTEPESNDDDQAQLVPTKRAGAPSYQNSGYLAFDASGKAGVADAAAVASDLQATITLAGEKGCGFEAPLEAMYRFLVDPEPPVSVNQVQGQSVATGINAALLAERNAFLRPDSALAIVILTDENDCSVRDDGVGWFVGSSSRMPKSTKACAANPNDVCCRSCAQRENAPPLGCSSLAEDDVCGGASAGLYNTWDAQHDSLNLRCFNQRQRFGFDLLYPVDRYSDALSNPRISNRAGNLVDNPLLAARDNKGPRSATLISVSLIVGAPWQDLATSASLTTDHDLEYLDGAGLESNQRWPLLIGDAENNRPPSDPFMIESVEPRTGKNPLTQDAIAPSNSVNPQESPINGHELNMPDSDDLQYACTFQLPTPIVCANGMAGCVCAATASGDSSGVISENSPLCQPPGGGPAGNTEYYGKGYPGARELTFARAMGARAVSASACPKTLSADAGQNSGYAPALNALVRRVSSTLTATGGTN